MGVSQIHLDETVSNHGTELCSLNFRGLPDSGLETISTPPFLYLPLELPAVINHIRIQDGLQAVAISRLQIPAIRSSRGISSCILFL